MKPLAQWSVRCRWMWLVLLTTLPGFAVVALAGASRGLSLAALAITSLAGLAAAWWLGEVTVVRPARRLSAAAERLEAGERGGPTELEEAAGEWKELATQFKRMTARLAAREQERQQREHTLQQSEQRFRLLLEQSALGIVVARSDKVVYANRTLARLCGCRGPEELIGMAVPEWAVGDAREGAREPLGQRDGGEPEPAEYEATIKRTDGGLLPVWVQSVRLELPEGPATAAAVVDISKRKRTEEALQLSEERYHRLFDNMADAVLVHEVFPERPPGRFVEVNGVACQRLGYSREELLCRGPQDIETAETQLASAAALKQVFPDGHALWEGVLVAKDGRRLPVEITNHLFEFNGKRLAFATARDITERKRAEEDKRRLEEQLRHAVKMEAVGRLAGGIAHDFNNITTGIIGYADMLLAQEDLTQATRADLSEIRRAAERAAALTRQLLAFSRKQIIAPVVMDLNLTVQDLQQMLSRLIGEDIALRWSPGHPLGRIKADPGQVEQILVNLAVNARDAMPNGGSLTMETREIQIQAPPAGTTPEARAGHWVMLVVSDNGCGMSREIQEHLFEPFFTTKEQGKGTGLGLATVYGIVEQHGGFITVHSEPGAGATFKIHFPRVEAALPKKERAQPLAALPRGTETILLVEDEPMVRSMVRRILERLGYKIFEAGCPADALAEYEHQLDRITMLLTDVIMPGMNGRQLYERLRALKPGLKVLFMSGYTQDAIAHHGVLEEGISFTPKPCTGEELAVKVRQVLDA